MVSEKVDIWQLGVLMYCLAFYSTPFENDNGTIDLVALRNGPVCYPQADLANYSAEFIDLLESLLVPDPSKSVFLCSTDLQTALCGAADRARLLDAVLAHDAGSVVGAGGVAAIAARAVASLRAEAAGPSDAERLGSVVEQRGGGVGAAKARSGGGVRQAERDAGALFWGPEEPQTVGVEVHVADSRAAGAPIDQEDRDGGVGDAVDGLLLPADLEVSVEMRCDAMQAGAVQQSGRSGEDADDDAVRIPAERAGHDLPLPEARFALQRNVCALEHDPGERRENRRCQLGAVHLALREHSHQQGLLPQQIHRLRRELRAGGRRRARRGGPSQRARAALHAARQSQRLAAVGADESLRSAQRRHPADARRGALALPLSHRSPRRTPRIARRIRNAPGRLGALRRRAARAPRYPLSGPRAPRNQRLRGRWRPSPFPPS